MDVVGRLGNQLVGMVEKMGAEVEGVLLLKFLQHGGVIARHRIARVPGDRRAEAPRRRLDRADRPRRAVEQLRVHRPLSERLVPDLPFVHHVPVAFDEGFRVAEPGVEGRGIVRHLAHAHPEPEVAAPDGIPVGDADPGLHAHRRAFANVRIEPAEVVDALLLLGLRPAGEESSALDAQSGQEFLEAVPFGVVAIHRLAPDRPRRRLHLGRRARGESANLLESGIHGIELLPRDARLLVLKHARRGRFGEMVAPGVPALDRRRVLERNHLLACRFRPRDTLGGLNSFFCHFRLHFCWRTTKTRDSLHDAKAVICFLVLSSVFVFGKGSDTFREKNQERFFARHSRIDIPVRERKNLRSAMSDR